MMIVAGLNRKLPQRYVAEPQVHLGSSIEIDVATYEEDEAGSPAAGEGERRRRGRDRGLGPAAADAGRRDRPAGPGRVRGARLRHPVGPAARGRRRDRQPGQQGPARAPPRLRRQVRRLAPGPRLRRDRRPRHDPHVQPVWRPAGAPRPDRPLPGRGTPSPLRRRLPLGEGRATPGCWRPGRIPWRSASRCRPCRCGSPRTSPCRSSWNRATRRRAASSASPSAVSR